MKAKLISTSLLLILATVLAYTNIQKAFAVTCSDLNNPAWVKGFNDARRDYKGLNGHGYDASTSLTGHDRTEYVAGYNEGWTNASTGSSLPSCSSPASPSSRPATTGCYNMNDAGAAWVKGYQDAQNDHRGINGHGYDPSTSLTGVGKVDYQSGYQQGWTDASKGVYGPFC